MCECGCGELRPYEVYRLGENYVALQVYPGCDGCETPVGLDIYVLTPEAAEKFAITGDVDGDLAPPELWLTNVAMPIIDPDILVEVAESEQFRAEAEDVFAYENLADWLKDYGRQLLALAVNATWEKYGPLRKKHRQQNGGEGR